MTITFAANFTHIHYDSGQVAYCPNMETAERFFRLLADIQRPSSIR